jgi:ferredoxin
MSGGDMTYDVAIGNTRESYRCRDTQNLLAGMEALSRKGIPVGCRGGGCGICKVRIESGSVRTERMSRAAISADEEGDGLVLACRAYPRSDLRLSAVDKLARCVERSYERSFLQRSRHS